MGFYLNHQTMEFRAVFRKLIESNRYVLCSARVDVSTEIETYGISSNICHEIKFNERDTFKNEF